MNWKVRQVIDTDREQIVQIVNGWGAHFIVSRGRKLFPQDLPGFVAVTEQSKIAGLATCEIVADQCELVTLDALKQFRGIGSALMGEVIKAARAAGCRRLWLITTNDNLDAIRFYQRRGLNMAAIHVNSLERSRQIKPSIPMVGQYGIPLTDEIEFEMIL